MKDWDLDDRPAELATPWATTLHRTDAGPGGRGLYLERESGALRSFSAWLDQFARHGERGAPRWSRSPGGVLYVVAGARVGLVWPGWSGGHMAAAGDRDGVWLQREVPFGMARRAVEDWWAERQAELAAVVDVDERVA